MDKFDQGNLDLNIHFVFQQTHAFYLNQISFDLNTASMECDDDNINIQRVFQFQNEIHKKKKEESDRKKRYRLRKNIIDKSNQLKNLGDDIYVVINDKRGQVHGVMSDRYKDEYVPNSKSIYNTILNIKNVNRPNQIQFDENKHNSQHVYAIKIQEMFDKNDDNDDDDMNIDQ